MSEVTRESRSWVQISELAITFRCPRKYYFQRTGKRFSSSRHLICRQVASGIPSGLDKDLVREEIHIIDPEISPEMDDFFEECWEACLSAPLMKAVQQDIPVRSERLNISGQIDKYDPSDTFAIIRSGHAPETGCWPEDRLRIAAYLLCFNETYHLDLTGARVEYIPSGIVRYYEPGPRDRRSVLHTIRMAESVRKGILPEKPMKAHCQSCIFQGNCETSARTLSDIFFKKRK